WRKRHAWGRGPVVGLAYFSVSLIPALGFFSVYPMRYSFVADHFQYLASIGIIAVVIGGAAWGFDQWVKSDADKTPVLNGLKAALGFFILVVWMTLTWKQASIYRDQESLWLDTLAKNNGSWLARSNLGNFYARENRLEEARLQFTEL